MSGYVDRPNSRGITSAFAVRNIRGVMFAMCATPQTLVNMLGCTLEEAARFKEEASYDFMMALAALRDAKSRMGAGA